MCSLPTYGELEFTMRDYATFHQACVNAFFERLVWVPVMCMFTAHAQVGVRGV